MMGVVFDIPVDSTSRFLDVFKYLTEAESKVDFLVTKCNTLPDLASEGNHGYGGGEDRGNF